MAETTQESGKGRRLIASCDGTWEQARSAGAHNQCRSLRALNPRLYRRRHQPDRVLPPRCGHRAAAALAPSDP
jgi:hypothetical protein